MSEPIKRAVTKTRIGIAGRITDPVLAESIVEKNQADFVGMTSALIADPHLPNKAREGLLDDIRPCIGTLQDCWGRSVSHEWPMHCTVNPAADREQTRGIWENWEELLRRKRSRSSVRAQPDWRLQELPPERGHKLRFTKNREKSAGR